MRKLIVSKHPAAVEFIRQELPEFADVQVLASATADDVAGAVVAGNLPLHLAAAAAEVVAVEFAGEAPRGQEYDLAAMRAAGARAAAELGARGGKTAAARMTPTARKERARRAALARWTKQKAILRALDVLRQRQERDSP